MTGTVPNTSTTLAATAHRAHLAADLDAGARRVLAWAAGNDLQPLADNFYRELLDDARARTLLVHQKVQDQLKPSLVRWISTLLAIEPDTLDDMLAVQHHVGQIHARIDVPLDLVIRAMGQLRRDLLTLLARAPAAHAERSQAVQVLCSAMDIALEAMTLAYSNASAQSTQQDVAFRLYSLIDNASAERERQRALLLDWENSLLYAVAGGALGREQTPLAISEFGLWFRHKGLHAFGQTTDSRRALDLITAIDGLLGQMDAQDVMQALSAIRDLCRQLGALLGRMFERISEIEAGVDTLTNLLNRRFLPTVLRREIDTANQSGTHFAVAMVDLDHFKQINDQYGHPGGDEVLQQVAAVLLRNVRGSDYVFRLGGEEMLVVLPAVNRSQALTIAEKLRATVAGCEIRISGVPRPVPVSASIGVALYDGHPDYSHLLTLADSAMYRAKRDGRNRVCVADE